MSISMVKKFYEMYENDAKETGGANPGKRKRKNKNAKFNFKKAALIQDEAPELKEVDFTEENLKLIKKLSVINSVKLKAVEKIMEHEDRLSKKAKKDDNDSSKDFEPVFSDRDFDVFEKEYLDK